MSELLVAALHPYDTWAEIHASSREYSQQPQLPEALALAIAGRSQELQLGDTPIKEALDPWLDAELSDDVSSEWRFIYVVIVATVSGRTVESHANWFKEFAADHDHLPELRVVSALLFSAFATLLDRTTESVHLLQQVRGDLPDLPPLAQALLQNQLGRRLLEKRQLDDALVAVEEAAVSIAAIKSDDEASSSMATKNVINALQSANQDIRIVSNRLRNTESPQAQNFFFNGWEEQNRRSRQALESFVNEVFNDTVRDAALLNRPQTWAASDTVGQTYRYLWINSEMLGDIYRSNAAAKTAGMLGLSRGDTDDQTAESLALLRLSGDTKNLKSALNTVRSRGPLHVLRDETLKVASRIQNRPIASRIARCDLLVLEYGAELLPQDDIEELSKALTAETNWVAVRDTVGTFRYDQLVWRAIASLVPLLNDPSNSLDDILSRLRRTNDALVRMEAQRLVSATDWTLVNEATASSWLRFAKSTDSDDQRLIVEILVRLARIGLPEAFSTLLARDTGRDIISLAAGILDVDRQSELAIPEAVLDRIVEQCRSSIAQMRDDAASGSFGFGGTDALVVATELSRRLHKVDMWADVAGALGDSRVAIAHKEGTLNWLTRYYDEVPSYVVNQLTGTAGALLEAPEQEFLSSGSTGPALRFLSRAGQEQNRNAVVNVFFNLAGSSDDLHRVEAARSAGAVIRFLSIDIVSGVLLQLARDSNLFVRVAAARRLPTLLGYEDSIQHQYVKSVTEAFLQSDGMSSPLAVLRGIEELDAVAGRAVRESLDESLHRVADNGGTDQIRTLARSLTI